MKNKKLDEYNDKYGNVPSDFAERFSSLLSTYKINIKDIEKLKKEIRRILKIKHNEISFVIYFTPHGTPRPRSSRFTKIFYVKNDIDYSKFFKEFMDSLSEIDFKIYTPCQFHATTYAPIPSSMNKIEKLLAELTLIKNLNRPDWDNLAKTYCDMIQNHLIMDDSLIYDGRLVKLFSAKPRIEISIRYMTEFDSKYNMKKVKSSKYYDGD